MKKLIIAALLIVAYESSDAFPIIQDGKYKGKTLNASGYTVNCNWMWWKNCFGFDLELRSIWFYDNANTIMKIVRTDTDNPNQPITEEFFYNNRKTGSYYNSDDGEMETQFRFTNMTLVN